MASEYTEQISQRRHAQAVRAALTMAGHTAYERGKTQPGRPAFLTFVHVGGGVTVSLHVAEVSDAYRVVKLAEYRAALTATGFTVEQRADYLYVHPEGGTGGKAE